MIRQQLAEYFRFVASMLDTKAVGLSLYQATKTTDPYIPNSIFAVLTGYFAGVDHRVVLHSWQSTALDPRLLTPIKLGDLLNDRPG